MDPTKEKIDLEINGMFNDSGGATGTISAGVSSDTITISSLWDSNTHSYSNTSVIGGGYTNGINYPNNISVTGGPYTLGAGISQPWYTANTNPKIQLNGEGADIEVNGESLIGMIKKIEERLNILHPNEKLEEEWEELRALGEQYRKLEQHIKDKQATWDKLKAMPAPIIE